MSDKSGEVREWVLGSIDLQRAVFGPSYGSTETIPVIEKSAYDKLKAENEWFRTGIAREIEQLQKHNDVWAKERKELHHLRNLLGAAREAFNTLSVAVNDKVDDPGATRFCIKWRDKLDAAIKGE